MFKDRKGNSHCKCLPHYFGLKCEFLNLCNSNPCSNNGKCENYDSFYKCICANNFTGNNCENKIQSKWKNKKN